MGFFFFPQSYLQPNSKKNMCTGDTDSLDRCKQKYALLGKKKLHSFFFIVLLQASIRNTFYDYKSQQHYNEEEKT